MASGRVFPTTKWTLIHSLRTAQGEERGELVGMFLRSYWQPMSNFVKWRFKLKHQDVEDMVQGFIADKLVQNQLLNHVDRERGQLRSFLQKAMQHYGLDVLRKKREQVGLPAEGLPEQEPPETPCPFDVDWAKTILQAAADCCRDEWASKGRPEVFRIVEGRSLLLLTGQTQPVSFEALAEQTKQSVDGVRKLLVTGQRSFGRCLKHVVGEYVQASEVDNEIKELQLVIAKAQKAGGLY